MNAPAPAAPAGARARVRLEIAGRVQGVGFRPFICRLARERSLAGWARNTPAGVAAEIEGEPGAIEAFLHELRRGTPAARPGRWRQSWIDSQGELEFEIRASDEAGEAEADLPPDLALCADCLREMRDPRGRRRGYAFINCTQCGPRASIIKALPYDRPRTTMAAFAMCGECRAEYESPEDRRFHAEPIACPACGPALAWRGRAGEAAAADEALARAAAALQTGGVVCVKGISGFHLMADAASEAAVRRLREIKRRDAKPFAVMFPDLARLRLAANAGSAEEGILQSAEAPIVLLERRPGAALAQGVAPNNPMVGAMLPYSPLHHLLMERLGIPLVATSANFGEEPIAISNADAGRMFGGLADGVLAHDREIIRRADDSIVRVIAGRACPIRLGRGMAPARVEIPEGLGAEAEGGALALGGHEKASIALARRGELRLGRHLGDLDTPAAREAYREAIEDFLAVHGFRPELIVCDRHPDYFSSRVAEEMARERGCRLLRVQHHAAHLYSAMLEAEAPRPRAAGICWDGTGLGADGAIWGGEWIVPDAAAPEGWRRAASLLPFALPGGEACAREPWRAALALALAAGVSADEIFCGPDRAGFEPGARARAGVAALLGRGAFAVRTSSAGRLFDGIASMLGLRHRAQFSAQPAMELEFLASGAEPHRVYELPIAGKDGLAMLDWRPLVRGVIVDLKQGAGAAQIASAVHRSLALGAAELTRKLGFGRAFLTGGCFQNKLLAESMIASLGEAGIGALTHAAIPPNDGGLAAGQALLGLHRLGKRT